MKAWWSVVFHCHGCVICTVLYIARTRRFFFSSWYVQRWSGWIRVRRRESCGWIEFNRYHIISDTAMYISYPMIDGAWRNWKKVWFLRRLISMYRYTSHQPELQYACAYSTVQYSTSLRLPQAQDQVGSYSRIKIGWEPLNLCLTFESQFRSEYNSSSVLGLPRRG